MTQHPSCLAEAELLAACTLRTGRRSGPGGQHRNKVETAVILLHAASGISAEANERRSQQENKQVALQRLRLELALAVRTPEPAAVPSPLWQQRCSRGKLAIAREHADFPCVLAELFDQLQAHDYALPPCAAFFEVSASQLVKLLRKWPPALSRVNLLRHERGLHKLT